MDVTKRPERIAQKIVNDTIHRLHDEYRRRWDQQGAERQTDEKALGEIADGGSWSSFREVDRRLDQRSQLEVYWQALGAGLIDGKDHYLLVGSRIYGHALSDCAAQVGLTYGAAKKRRQRAEKRIGVDHTDFSAENLSPLLRRPPLSLMGRAHNSQEE
jgi:hypothetical protein